MLKTILSISGKPGLYKLVSQGKNMLIVESIEDNKKRMPIYGAEKVISLGDIAMYTDDSEVPLREVFNTLKEKYNGQKVDFNAKKAKSDELFDFLTEVLPDFDRDRVYPNDVKKLISWYNVLIVNGFDDFSENKKEASKEESEES
jgi:hypothetical protein